jgi:hypothetical protein
MDTRLRVGRAIGKDENVVATALMAQLKSRGHPDKPPTIVTDGKGSYREAMVETWGQVPDYAGRGRPPTKKQPRTGWNYVQVIKRRSGYRLTGIKIKVIYGDPEEVLDLLGGHTAYIERTNLTNRQMNGRLVRKTLSFSKELKMLEASWAWEDWVYNLMRSVKTPRVEVNDGHRRWQPHSPVMAAGLTDHVWTVKELTPVPWTGNGGCISPQISSSTSCSRCVPV